MFAMKPILRPNSQRLKSKQNVVFYHPVTGERVSIAVPREKGLKYQFSGGFMVIGLDTLRLLRNLDMPKDAHKVLYWFWENMEFRNVVTDFTYQSIGEACGIANRSRVCHMVKLLEQAGLIRRGKSRGLAFLNPHHYFRGTPAEQRRALEVWDRGDLHIVRVEFDEDVRDSFSA
jgi:hypothetical protein